MLITGKITRKDEGLILNFCSFVAYSFTYLE